MHIELGVVALTCRHLQTSFTRSSGCVCPALWGLGLMDGPGRRTGVLSFMLQQQSSSLKEQGDHSLLLQGTILLSTPRKVLFSLFALSFNSIHSAPAIFRIALDCAVDPCPHLLIFGAAKLGLTSWPKQHTHH